MKIFLSLLFTLSSLLVVLPKPAAAESQTWKVRPGDTLDIIAATLEIPKEEITQLNPGVLESNLQIGQKLKLPLRSFQDSKTIERELRNKDKQIEELGTKNSDLGKAAASAESQLHWHPIWLWGFWICFGILAFIASGAYWIFRQTHPKVFEQPHDRSVRDLKESQIRVRSSFPSEEESVRDRGRRWQSSLKRIPAHR